MSRLPTTPAHKFGSPPRRFARAHHSRESAEWSLLPKVGVVLTLAATLLGLVVTPLCSLLLIVSSAPAIFGGWLRKPLLQKIGVGVMVLLSLGWLGLANYFFVDDLAHDPFMLKGFSRTCGLITLAMGLVTGLNALLLSLSWGPVKDETSVGV